MQGILRDEVALPHAVHAVVVGDREAGEAPALPEDILHQAAVAGAGHTVDGIVGDHDALRAGADARGKRLQLFFFQLPPRGQRRVGIPSALGIVIHEMLWCGDHAVLLQSADVGRAHAGVEQDGLAIRFLRASPAAVARQIDDGGEYRPHADGTQLLCHGVADAADQLRVERGSQSDRLREHGGPSPAGTVQCLAVLQYGDAQPVRRDRAARVFVDAARDLPGRVQLRRQKTTDVAHMADAKIAVVVFLPVHQHLAAQLVDLFLRGHLGK